MFSLKIKNSGLQEIKQQKKIKPQTKFMKTSMLKKIFSFITVMVFAISADAQNYAGYSTGNFTGINGVFFNPANIADSRYRWDVNLVSLNATLANDYATLKVKGLSSLINGDSLDAFLDRRVGKNANIMADFDVFGPSFMFNINSQNSFAITTRARSMINIDKLPGTLLNALEDDNSPITYPTALNQDKFIISSNLWSEFGLSFGHVISNNKQHFFKGGITLKYLMGAGSGYIGLSNLKGTLDENFFEDKILRSTTGNISYGSAGLSSYDDFKIKANGSGIGADLGVVYEYRPDYGSYNNADNSFRKDLNKYKYKLELAVHDLGSIKYKNSKDHGSYTLNTALNPNGQDTLMLNRFEDISDFSDISHALDAASPMITKTSSDGSSYTFSLPTSITASFDYNFNKGFFVNLGGMFAVNQGSSNARKTHAAHYIMVTPRYEGKSFGAYLPISYNNISGFNSGISLRGGPFFIGSGSILSTLISGKTKHVDIHTGLRFGMLQKKKKVKEAPIAEAPKIVDTDGDGINDEEDKCPTVAGLAKYNGCPIPDTDGDGINDEEDKCPTVAGLAKYNGCPIPDTDGDGINDEEDKCPTVAGLAKYNGCPIPDTDGDGINDEEDKCPDRAGTKENQGCPEIKKEVLEKINVAARNIFYATGSFKLMPKSYKSLDEVVALMKEDPTLKLQVDGYTDAQGDETKNQLLSEKRANSVKDYLLQKGIDAGRITAIGHGEENPIADNNTAAGRAKNRRTEMNVTNY